MVNGKVWVRRREGSPTLVDLRDEDLVDNLKDAILRKYQNALGRHYDAPDLQLRIIPRAGQGRQRDERHLEPDELVVRALEEYFPGGQSVSEALVIEVPPLRERRTPRPSPNQPYAYYGGHGHETFSGGEGNDYFSQTFPSSTASHPTSSLNNSQIVLQQPSMSALAVGQPPSIPGSPGNRRLVNRPPLKPRHTTSGGIPSSTNVMNTGGPVVMAPKSRPRGGSDAASSSQTQPAPQPPLPTPPVTEEAPKPPVASPPPVRVSSPRPPKFKNEQKSKAPAGLVEGTVPPINVLIVEDNSINLRLLEAFMKRLKVRWQSAVNGMEAVTKWRAGGFHLVLMDIHLPVMNGLEATKEIRRLEKVNGIGVFSHGPGADSDRAELQKEVPEEDRLSSTFLFKSPVIIVALTASSLQSDRHEALAAGCNDFLTKPVNNLWLEKKLTEWGCMQALIDFDGWKKWKDLSAREQEEQAKGKRPGGNKRERQRSGGPLASSTGSTTFSNGSTSDSKAIEAPRAIATVG
ncbi:hypothetical protein BDZ91DRAFT_664654 [Kalaharituber pfeilii]|nr:hypothetical protein BDZ91DRAFT_664654 [Kalaharituber pfeilii]